jgi:hypothetical protein
LLFNVESNKFLLAWSFLLLVVLLLGVPSGGVVVVGGNLCYYTSTNQEELGTKELGRTRPKGSDVSRSS